MAEQTAYQYDVFISYSHTDRDWVWQELLPRLQAADLLVCIDDNNFEIGIPRLVNIERAVDHSRYTLVVLTPDWLSDKWTAFEAHLAHFQDASGLERRIIPLILRPCQTLPKFIGLLTSVDFADPGQHMLAWNQLLTGLGKQQSQEIPNSFTPPQWCLPHPYNVEPNFTGRDAEQATLSQWLQSDGGHPLLVLRAPGGFGKSALAWHWLLKSVTQTEWPQVVWWSFYRDNNFDAFVQKALDYIAPNFLHRTPLTVDQQADELLERLKRNRILLILNGFEQALYAYGKASTAVFKENEPNRRCISPAAERFLNGIANLPLQSKALMTTRLLPHALEGHSGDRLQGCREIPLDAMRQSDAINFFQAQGIRGSRKAIGQACALYGYHPLSLRRLANGIVNDLERPGHIAVAGQVDVIGNLRQKEHHVLDLPFRYLTPAQRDLLKTIAQHQKPISYQELQRIAPNNIGDATKDELRGLQEWGLVYRKARDITLDPIVHLYIERRLVDRQQQPLTREVGSPTIPRNDLKPYTAEQPSLGSPTPPNTAEEHPPKDSSGDQLPPETEPKHNRLGRIWYGRRKVILPLITLMLIASALVGWQFWPNRGDIPSVGSMAIEIDGISTLKAQSVTCGSVRLIEVKLLDLDKTRINPNEFSYTWSLDPPDGNNKDIFDSKNFTFSYYAPCTLRDKTQNITLQVMQGNRQLRTIVIPFNID